MKRLTLSDRDALHAYDWLRMYWRGDDQKFGGCFECEQIGRRLERFIGPAAVRRIARLSDVRTTKKHAKEKKG